MATADLDVIKDIPGYKVILKAVVRNQIQQLVEQLAAHTDEESVILTASVADGTLSHIGSESGKSFLEDHEDVKSQFLGFCLKYHHRKRQEEKDKERQQQELLEQEKMHRMMNAAATYPRPLLMSRTPRLQSPRYASPRHPGLSPRVAPYPVTRPRRAAPPSPSSIKPPKIVSGDGQIIKIEAEGSENSNDNSDIKQQGNASSDAARQASGDDDEQSESPAGTPGVSTEGLHLESDFSNLIASETEAAVDGLIDQPDPGIGEPHTATAGSSSDIDRNLSVKLEAVTESEMELEITGVEPGRPLPIVSMPQDNWGAMGMNFDTLGATGSPADMMSPQGTSSPVKLHSVTGQDLSPWGQIHSPRGHIHSPLGQIHSPLGHIHSPLGQIHSARGGNYSPGGAGDTSQLAMLRLGMRAYQCNICSKSHPTSTKLKIHMRIHSGERPYGCKVCGKHFKQKQHLNGHMTIHLKL